MNAVEGLGGILSSTGEVSGPFQYKGVSLEDLCQLVGGITSSSVIRAIAKDGYGISFGYRNIVEDDYITYDPTTKREMPHGDLTTILAYEEGGQLLTTQIGGPLRLCVVGSDPLIVDGHWSVKWVNKIEIVEQEISQQNFTLHLVGAITKNIDRASFESCAAPGCHGVSWTDNKGDTWSGVPLWYFVGEVDDETTGDAPGSFNDELVDNGYDVKVIAADDYSVTFASTDVARNPYIFLANEVNGKPLPEDYWPLRVVGPDLAGQQKVGQVVRIEVILP
jgi:DMSO/TMAO reductase YedYZ molybdopterin-dependent catalytic subunit